MLLVFIAVLVIVMIVTLYEFIRNDLVKVYPARPEAGNSEEGFAKIMKANIHDLVSKLEEGHELDSSDYETINNTCDYIDVRYDCSDFRIQTLIRLFYRYANRIDEKAIQRMKKTLLGFKFFMDQPGEDSLCLWSENHLILFATAEYLIGQLYENETFTNDGLTGKAHKEIAKERIMIWLKQRFDYGYIEWYSNTYYEEDIAPLANLIEFCDDDGIVVRTQMAMDLLLHDLASQSYKGSFTSTSGRQYEDGKKSGNKSALKTITNQIWGYDGVKEEKGLDQNFLYMKNYEVPDVIKEIGLNHDRQVIKASSGLDLKELINIYPNEKATGRVMMQWAMEAFSSPEVIGATTRYIHKHNMMSNEFMVGFKMINLSILKLTGLLPVISKIIRPMTNGAAIQRVNSYTYKTENYMLATAQKYHPGDFGDQHHIWSATLAPDLCVFTTHPAAPMSEDGALSASPGYWVGNGRNPHSVQDEQVNITIYNIENRKGFMEKALLHKTHCYFPVNRFDEVILNEKSAYGRKGNAFIAVRGFEKFKQSGDELIQEGALTCWITELGSLEDESFAEFVERVGENNLSYDRKTNAVTYKSLGRTHTLVYQGDYKIDNHLVTIENKRFDSLYACVNREDSSMSFELSGKKLVLDFEKGLREVLN